MTRPVYKLIYGMQSKNKIKSLMVAVLRYNIVAKLKLIKIEFDSDTVKLMSERVNLLSWAVSGLNYIGFELQGISKIVTIIIGWVLLQYLSFVLVRVSKTLKKEESHGTN